MSQWAVTVYIGSQAPSIVNDNIAHYSQMWFTLVSPVQTDQALAYKSHYKDTGDVLNK